MPLTVFISYAREDSAAAKQVASALEREGYAVLLDQSFITAGQFTTQLDQAIARSNVLVLLVSMSSVRSPWVNREVHLAVDDYERPVLPVVLEDVDVDPFRLVLAGLQRVDLRQRSPQQLADVVDGVYRSIAGGRRRRVSPATRAAGAIGTLLAVVGGVVCVGAMGYFFWIFAEAWNAPTGSDPPSDIPYVFLVFFAGMVVAGVGQGLRQAARNRRPSAG